MEAHVICPVRPWQQVQGSQSQELSPAVCGVRCVLNKELLSWVMLDRNNERLSNLERGEGSSVL